MSYVGQLERAVADTFAANPGHKLTEIGTAGMTGRDDGKLIDAIHDACAAAASP